MSADRVFHLEQALLAIIAVAERQGMAELLRRQAIGGLTANTRWSWVVADHVPGAINEIEIAVQMLRKALPE
ncbi:hypothetical protein ACIQUS_15705 [Pseudomonas sp. NPDC090755]|uniref:hypothetical protein n=1 Tax=Pseudomonas sp. NPDC090755 TaxID=3364481 RepID=UPI00383B5A3A